MSRRRAGADASDSDEDTVMTERTTPVKKKQKGKRPLRIGFLVNSGYLEAKKCELVSTRIQKPVRPWFKHIDEEYIVSRGEDPCLHQLVEPRWLPEQGVGVDTATGLYMRWKFGDKVHVDMIPAKEVSPERLLQNDLNFLMLYDDLEAFHTDRSHGKAIYKRTVATLSTATNVFPPRYYQELVNSKINYYTHLMNHGLTICPTICLPTDKYEEQVNKLGQDAAGQNILAEIDKRGWRNVFCKPVLGIESRDAQKFVVHTEAEKSRIRFKSYIKRICGKYPGVVIQKFMPNFGNHIDAPEIRLIYVGDEFQYSVIQTDYITLRPAQEYKGDEKYLAQDVPMKMIREFAEKVIASLPDIVIEGVTLPRYITRLDLGFRPDGPEAPPRPFVNEIEYVPSLYVEGPGIHDHCIERVLGDQVFKITKKFVSIKQSSRPIRSPRRKNSRAATVRSGKLKRSRSRSGARTTAGRRKSKGSGKKRS